MGVSVRPTEVGGRGGGRSADPILVAAEHWRSRGWDAGPHLRAALSISRVDEAIRLCTDAALQPHRLTRAKHEALAVLYFSRHGEMALGQLGQRLLVHPTSVTATVDALERLDLVRRTAHPGDRRTTLAQITPKGRRTTAETCGLMAAQRCGLEALTERDAQRIFAILAKVRADAGELERPQRGRPVDDPVLEAELHWESQGWTARPWFRAALSIYRTAGLIRESNEAALRRFKLTHVRYEALSMLYFSGDLTMGCLSARLLVHPTSVTSTVDTLHQLGYARRVPHPTDRRATLARITPSGRRAVEETIESMTAAACGLAALTGRDAASLFTLLRKVRCAARPAAPH